MLVFRGVNKSKKKHLWNHHHVRYHLEPDVHPCTNACFNWMMNPIFTSKNDHFHPFKTGCSGVPGPCWSCSSQAWTKTKVVGCGPTYWACAWHQKRALWSIIYLWLYSHKTDTISIHLHNQQKISTAGFYEVHAPIWYKLVPNHQTAHGPTWHQMSNGNKTPVKFHNTGWFKGILIMADYTPTVIGYIV